MSKAKSYAADGAFKEEVDLPEQYFNAEVSEGCVYLTVKAYLAHQRQGTAKTKGRSEVAGSGTKPWKQKGTGRARAGSVKSPIWVRGGKAHGAQPRNYVQKVNKKVKRKALLSALTSKAQNDSIHVIESMKFSAPKTSDFIKVMEKAELAKGKVLCLAGKEDENLYKTARNIPWVTVMRVEDVNTYSLLRADDVVFSQASLSQLTGES